MSGAESWNDIADYGKNRLAWRLSITLDVSFCIEALGGASTENGNRRASTPIRAPRHLSEVFTGRLKQEGIVISMDGRGLWRDNVFVERLWRSSKYEEVCLHAYASIQEARTSLERY